jgi:hypothetical protein
MLVKGKHELMFVRGLTFYVEQTTPGFRCLTSIAQNIASQIQFTTFMLEDESTYFAPD